MYTGQFSVVINRPVKEVFQYASDTNKLVDWGEGIEEVTVTSDDPLGVGTKYVIKNRMGRRLQEFENEVLIYEPTQKFGFRSGGGAFGFYTSTRIFEEQHGKTLVTETIEAEGPAGILRIFMPLIIGFIKKSHHDSLIRLKEILES
jgi:uncharacterized membrane protein